MMESRSGFLKRAAAVLTGAAALPLAGAQKALAATVTYLAAVEVRSVDTTKSLLRIDANHHFGWGTEGASPRPLLLENTGNKGPGMSLYSNNGDGGNGRLLAVTAANRAFDASAVHVSYNGTVHGVSIEHVNASSASGLETSQALNVVSSNPLDTAVGIRGKEVGKGSLKVTHDKPAGAPGNDASASAVSLWLRGTGTAAKGIHIDTETGTTGRLADFRNDGVHVFYVGSDGKVWLKSLAVGNAVGASAMGAVVRKMEVFDYAGNSLGFVPIHAS